MAQGRRKWGLGLYWIPFVVGLLTACVYVFFLMARSGEFKADMVVTLVLGVAVGLLAVAQAIFAASDTRALAEARRRGKVLEERLATAHDHSKQLSSHVEVLTAMREVTRILSDAVDLREIARSVFDVLVPLLGAEEIALFLKDEDGGLTLTALRRENETLYADQLSGNEVEMNDAAQALEYQTLMKAVTGSSGVFCVPLGADQNAVGVMRFEIPLEGSHEDKERRTDEFEVILSDIAKHLALVVKTPSLHDRAIIDSLTGLFTRRHFDIRIDDMFRLARRYGTPFSVILLDIDHFKQVNDSHGHRAGDCVLRETAELITSVVRDCDSAFRYGGEEFAVLLPETTREQAKQIAERLRKAVKSHTTQAEGASVSITISSGVSEYGPDLAGHGELIALADKALYAAKSGGRDRTVAVAEGGAEA